MTEKQIEESYNALVSSVRKRIIEQMNQKLQKIESTLRTQCSTDEDYSIAKLNVPLEDTCFEKLFVIDNQFNMKYPQERPKNLEHIESIHTEETHLFETAYQYEFQDKNYQGALEAYQKIVGNSQEEKLESIGPIFVAIARCYLQLGEEDKALEKYKNLIDLDARNHNELLFLINIRFSIIELYKKNNNKIEYYNSLLNTLDYLLHNELRLSKVLYCHYYKKIEEYLQELDHENSLTEQEIKNFRLERDKIIERRDLFEQQSREVEEIHKKIVPRLQLEKEKSGYIDYEVQNNQCLIYYIQLPFGYVLYKLSLDSCIKYIIRPVLENQALSSDVQLSLSNNSGDTLLFKPDAQSSPILCQQLDPVFRFWKIDLYLKNVTSLKELSRYLSQLYLTALIVIISLLLVGFFITIFIVVREIKNARLKSDFVSSVTHELKTPLTAIKIFVETMQLGRAQTLEDQKECLQIIAAESDRLSRLIDQILNFARMEQKRRIFHFRSCCMESLIEQIVQDFQNQISNRATCEIVINKDDNLPQIFIDPEAIREAVTNLLSNAYKYNDKKEKKIEIHIYLHKITEMAISIKDNGIGIPRNELHRIFQKFYRVENTLTTHIEGTGLGLSLVESIVRAHKGNLKVQSKFRQGSEFTIFLPM